MSNASWTQIRLDDVNEILRLVENYRRCSLEAAHLEPIKNMVDGAPGMTVYHEWQRATAAARAAYQTLSTFLEQFLVEPEPVDEPENAGHE